MKSIEIIVPRKLIVGFYPHPEYYGDFIVELENGMITDVYYNEAGDFITITSEIKLVKYLRKQKATPIEFFFRNGVYAFRKITDDDNDRITKWNTTTSITITDSIPCDLKRLRNYEGIPKRMIVTFYWIEIGIIDIIFLDNQIKLQLNVFEFKFFEDFIKRDLLSPIDFEMYLHTIKEHLYIKLLK